MRMMITRKADDDYYAKKGAIAYCVKIRATVTRRGKVGQTQEEEEGQRTAVLSLSLQGRKGERMEDEGESSRPKR